MADGREKTAAVTRWIAVFVPLSYVPVCLCALASMCIAFWSYVREAGRTGSREKEAAVAAAVTVAIYCLVHFSSLLVASVTSSRWCPSS